MMTPFYKKIVLGLVGTFLLVICIDLAMAQTEAETKNDMENPLADPMDDSFQPGFSGYIQPMVGVGYSKSLSTVGDDNKRIDSLDQEAESETKFFPMILWNMGYTLENGTTQFFAGTPEENIIEGTFLVELGIAQKLSDGTVLSAAYIPQIPGLDDEVWTDPYLLGSDRTETDRDSQAFRVAAESILGSPFSLKYGFGSQDIDNDQTGLYLSQQAGSTLTTQDLQSLKRSGNFHQIEALYAIDISENTMIQPGLIYTRADADGDANSFDRIGGHISLTTSVAQYHFFTTLSLSHAEYDENNPVFNQTRKEWTYDAIIGAGYMAPFGYDDFMVNLYTGFTKEDANIGFYDSTAIFGGVGLTWMF